LERVGVVCVGGREEGRKRQRAKIGGWANESGMSWKIVESFGEKGQWEEEIGVGLEGLGEMMR
jgi:hypothetical protein